MHGGKDFDSSDTPIVPAVFVCCLLFVVGEDELQHQCKVDAIAIQKSTLIRPERTTQTIGNRIPFVYEPRPTLLLPVPLQQTVDHFLNHSHTHDVNRLR